MGTTSKPIRMLVLDADLWESPEIQSLAEKGHQIDGPDEITLDYDVILGRRAWYCDDKHLKYLEKVMIPAIRNRADYTPKVQKAVPKETKRA